MAFPTIGLRPKTQILFLLLTSAAAAQPTSDCAVQDGMQDIFGAPTLIKPVMAGIEVTAAPEAVIAQEQIQVATRIWRTDRALLTFSAGSPVTALLTDEGERKCIRDATELIASLTIPCLVDEDGDGRYETAQLYKANQIVTTGAPSRFVNPRVVRIAPPLTLTNDPDGLVFTRQHLYRRVRVVAVSGSDATVALEHASQNVAPPQIVYQPQVRNGRLTYKLDKTLPAKTAPAPAFSPLGTTGTIRLADGEQAFAGMRFTVRAVDGAWTITPQAPRFVNWISFECTGTRLRIASLR